jgi:hypothetical protein
VALQGGYRLDGFPGMGEMGGLWSQLEKRLLGRIGGLW